MAGRYGPKTTRMAKEQRSHLASPLFDDQIITIWTKIIDALREQFVFLIPYYQSNVIVDIKEKNLFLVWRVYVYILLLFFLTAKS